MQSTINQTRHWFSARRKLSDELISSFTVASSRASSFFDSCKEQSFSDFSSAAAGDSWSFWLPKSFNCSFCRREFRSAQALGGHMNVHRVERVRLKLASSSNLNPSTSSECNPNPNPNPNSSSQSSENNCGKNLLVKGSMDLKLGREEMDCGKRKEFCVGYDVVSNNKKKKTTDLMLALSCTSYKDELELCKIYGPINDEEVDLELRLGGSSKTEGGLQSSCH